MDQLLIIWNDAATIIKPDNKILMAKEKGTIGWDIPPEEVENGESPEQACVREV